MTTKPKRDELLIAVFYGNDFKKTDLGAMLRARNLSLAELIISLVLTPASSPSTSDNRET